MKTKKSWLSALILGATLLVHTQAQAQALPKNRPWENLRFRISADVPAISNQLGLPPGQVRARLKDRLKEVGIGDAESTEVGVPAVHLRVEVQEDQQGVASAGTVELLFSYPAPDGSMMGTAYAVRWDRRRELRRDLADNLPEAVEEVCRLFLRDYIKANPKAKPGQLAPAEPAR